jgi:hypothetical protein
MMISLFQQTLRSPDFEGNIDRVEAYLAEGDRRPVSVGEFLRVCLTFRDFVRRNAPIP